MQTNLFDSSARFYNVAAIQKSRAQGSHKREKSLDTV